MGLWDEAAKEREITNDQRDRIRNHADNDIRANLILGIRMAMIESGEDENKVNDYIDSLIRKQKNSL